MNGIIPNNNNNGAPFASISNDCFDYDFVANDSISNLVVFFFIYYGWFSLKESFNFDSKSSKKNLYNVQLEINVWEELNSLKMK